MKGLWKNNLGGYTTKGSKRKTQTIKNHIRENGSAIYKIYTPDRNNDEITHKKIDENILRGETFLSSYHLDGSNVLTSWGNEYIFNTHLHFYMIKRSSSLFSKKKRGFIKYINKSTRSSFRQWIYNSDWNIDRKIPVWEKSIDYWLS